MHCYEGKTDYPQDCKQRRSKPVHSVVEKSGSNRWLSWSAKELNFHRLRNDGTQDGEVSHGLGGKPHSHQLRRVDRYVFALERRRPGDALEKQPENAQGQDNRQSKIGRASCRERVERQVRDG